MREPMTEPFEPYESYEDDSYDWVEEEPHEERPMNIKWGRVAILGGALLFAFIFGRATKSAGIPESELTKARQEISELEDQNEDLRAELAAQPETLPATTAEEEPAAEEDTDATDPEGDEIVGETYTVKNGDTLRGIAQRFYGDAELADYLQEVNNIEDPTAISVGMTLIIPDEPPE